MFTLLAPAPSLISVGLLSRFFSAGAAIAARELRYVHVAELIIFEVLSPQRVASMFKLSACKTRRSMPLSSCSAEASAGVERLPMSGALSPKTRYAALSSAMTSR